MTQPPGTPGREAGTAHSAPDAGRAPARRRRRHAAGGITPEADLRHDARRLGAS
jgi:hypothetical protein